MSEDWRNQKITVKPDGTHLSPTGKILNRKSGHSKPTTNAYRSSSIWDTMGPQAKKDK